MEWRSMAERRRFHHLTDTPAVCPECSSVHLELDTFNCGGDLWLCLWCVDCKGYMKQIRKQKKEC